MMMFFQNTTSAQRIPLNSPLRQELSEPRCARAAGRSRRPFLFGERERRRSVGHCRVVELDGLSFGGKRRRRGHASVHHGFELLLWLGVGRGSTSVGSASRQRDARACNSIVNPPRSARVAKQRTLKKLRMGKKNGAVPTSGLLKGGWKSGG